jgi:hypothetical protein
MTREISEETRKKHRKNQLGKLFWNNGIITVTAAECPGPEWKNGRVMKNSLKGKPKSEETKENMRKAWDLRRAKAANKS